MWDPVCNLSRCLSSIASIVLFSLPMFLIFPSDSYPPTRPNPPQLHPSQIREELGLVRSPGSRVRARGSSCVDATLELDGLEVIHDVLT
ncbi:hypothetical protein CUMW_170990 [Citrus unshiu]|nr:hypothetical protein CUMW_170990 [Citrus unshiu]